MTRRGFLLAVCNSMPQYWLLSMHEAPSNGNGVSGWIC